MSVIVENLQGGSSRSTTTFIDNFPTNGPLGELWAAGVQIINPSPYVALPSADIQPSSVDGNPCMKVSTNGPGAVGSVVTYQQVPLLPVGLMSRSQFCEMRVVRFLRTAGVNNLFAGPVVLSVMSGLTTTSQAYIYQMTTPAQLGVLIRRNGTVQTGLSGVFAFVDNDLIRLEAQINTSDVTLRIFINGVQQGPDIVDNAVGRLTTGLPGWMATSMNEPSGNYVCEWRNFNCGPV